MAAMSDLRKLFKRTYAHNVTLSEEVRVGYITFGTFKATLFAEENDQSHV